MLFDEPTGLHAQVYNYMMDGIFRQKFSYGQKISEEEIAQALDVSRTPIREALRKLEADGLVEILPKRFAQIVSFDEKTLRELGTVKLQLDFVSAQLAIHYGSNSDFDVLLDVNHELADAIKAGDHYSMLRLDTEFHQLYYRLTGNDLLMRFQRRLQTSIALYHSVRLREDPSLLDRAASDHSEILSALYDRDTDRLLRIIVPHIVRVFQVDPSIYAMPLIDYTRGRVAPPLQATQLTGF